MDVVFQTQDRIRALCRQADISLYQLSKQAKMSSSTLYSIMNGQQSNPSISILQKICGGFGISLYDFFDTEEFRRAGTGGAAIQNIGDKC